MTVTIQLDEALLQDVERLAAKRQSTVPALIEIALTELLHRNEGEPQELPVFRGGNGLRPGVDLDNSAALLDWMEQRDVAG